MNQRRKGVRPGYDLYARTMETMKYDKEEIKAGLLEEIILYRNFGPLSAFLSSRDLSSDQKVRILSEAIVSIEEKAKGNRPRTPKEIEDEVYYDLTHE